MSDGIFGPLPKACPTCRSDDPGRYYGSCFDNLHSTVFEPRLAMDPWHHYMRCLSNLLRDVDSLTLSLKVSREMAAARSEGGS